MYVELYGSNLSTTTRTWAGSDFNGPNAPTTLDGVSVKVNGKTAFVYYISPSQININTQPRLRRSESPSAAPEYASPSIEPFVQSMCSAHR